MFDLTLPVHSRDELHATLAATTVTQVADKPGTVDGNGTRFTWPTTGCEIEITASRTYFTDGDLILSS